MKKNFVIFLLVQSLIGSVFGIEMGVRILPILLNSLLLVSLVKYSKNDSIIASGAFLVGGLSTLLVMIFFQEVKIMFTVSLFLIFAIGMFNSEMQRKQKKTH